jgi:hypothetical protein
VSRKMFYIKSDSIAVILKGSGCSKGNRDCV